MRIEQVMMTRGAVDQLGGVVLLVGDDGSILDANSASSRCYGYALEDLLALNASDIATERHEPSSADGRPGGPGDETISETEHRRSDGSTFPVEVRLARVGVDDESATLWVVRDITERKRAEEALRKSEERFRAVADLTYDWEAWNASDGRYLYVSPSCERITGHTASEFLADPDLTVRITHPDDLDACSEHHEKAVGDPQGPDLELDFRIMRPDGEVRWINHRCTAVYGSRGQRLGRRESNRDITDRKLAEDALNDARWRLESIIEGTNVGTWEWNVQTQESTLNEVWANIIGYTLEELSPTSIDTEARLAHPDDLKASDEQLERHFAGEIPYYDCEIRLKHKDGHWVWVQDRGRVITWTEDGKPLMMFGTHTDITERKQAEQELEQHAAQLVELLSEREDHLEQLSRSLSSVINVVTRVVEARDPYTAGHQRRVSELAVAIAQDLGFSESEVDDIRIAALIHDVGKISVPAEILSKPGQLTEAEFELIKGHSETGYQIIASANMEGPTAEVVYQHHERCDGSGYPRGLVGHELLEGARVLMVADVVEAMVSHRPYRAGLNEDFALAEIEQGSGRLYDSRVVDSCLRAFREQGFEFSEA